jgi:hypothetical protein
VSESILEKLGRTEGIEHRFCDPVDNDDDKREQFWLSRIKDCKNRNVLFVCGFEHVESFRKKLITADFDVEHESKHWCNFSIRELFDSDP